MNDRIKLIGEINFSPINKTKKHNNQAPWKRVAMVMLDGDICEYYSWFIYKRFGLNVIKPLRRAHISFINDSLRDLTQNGLKTEEEANIIWENAKKKWDGKKIEVVLDLNIKTDGNHIWLNVPHDERGFLQSIRTEIGLGKPFFGMHMTIGTPHPFQKEHLEYIHESIKNGHIT